MPLNNTNLLLSLAILQNKGVARDRMLAASVGAALVPGILGLAVPLIVAANEPQPAPGDGTRPDTGKSPTLTKVPDVKGKTEQEAVEMIKSAGLKPVVTRAFFTPVAGTRVPDKGTVANQDPKPSDEWVDAGTEVRLEVSLGEKPATIDAEAEHRALLEIDKEMQKKMTDMDAKVDQILTKVGNWDKTGGGAAAKH